MLASLQTDLPQTEKRTATIKVSGSGGGSRNMLSKTTEYALRSVVYVAMHHDAKRVGLKEIARELELPEPFIGKILQNLVRQGVLASVKGPNGGFSLGRPASTISIMDLVRIIDGMEAFKRCGLGLKDCSDTHPCPLHHEFKQYRENLVRLFTKTTIHDLVRDIETGEYFIKNFSEKKEGGEVTPPAA